MSSAQEIERALIEDSLIGVGSTINPLQSSLKYMSADLDAGSITRTEEAFLALMGSIAAISQDYCRENTQISQDSESMNLYSEITQTKSDRRLDVENAAKEEQMTEAILRNKKRFGMNKLSRKRDFPFSLEEGIQFAKDLELMATEVTMAHAAPAPAAIDVTVPAPVHIPVPSDPMKFPQAQHPQVPCINQRLMGPAPGLSENSVNRNVKFTAANPLEKNTKAPRASQREVSRFTSGRDLYVKDGGILKENSTHKDDRKNGSAVKAIGSTYRNPGKGQINTGGVVDDNDFELPDELAHLDKSLVKKIDSEIIHHGQKVAFNDIAGLEEAKRCVQELICWPITRPDLFQGLRALPRGVLLFGPPGTGKTLIGKAIAYEAGATFFSISASSLMSKWIGEGEKTVRTLFAVAAYRQPAVVFLDEVDSLLTQRSSEENEASRRMKTEFLVQLDGAGTDLEAQVVVVGASNRPEELDEAARRRFVKRIYIPLPDIAGRRQLFETLLRDSKHSLGEADFNSLISDTLGYSGADIRALCTEAAMGPMREIAISTGDLKQVRNSDVPGISKKHFADALASVMPTVSDDELTRYINWNTQYGTFKVVLTPT